MSDNRTAISPMNAAHFMRQSGKQSTGLQLTGEMGEVVCSKVFQTEFISTFQTSPSYEGMRLFPIHPFHRKAGKARISCIEGHEVEDGMDGRS